jgi:hypothetical protein
MFVDPRYHHAQALMIHDLFELFHGLLAAQPLLRSHVVFVLSQQAKMGATPMRSHVFGGDMIHSLTAFAFGEGGIPGDRETSAALPGSQDPAARQGSISGIAIAAAKGNTLPMRMLTKDIQEILKRKDRFTYDLRAGCQVYGGVVAAYRTPDGNDHFTDLQSAVAHAFENEGLVGGWKIPGREDPAYDSCRLFTDMASAMRFAKEQGRQVVFNLNRDREMPLSPGATRMA